MAAEIICDGCGNWFKPSKWFERSDDDGIQSACSRECIEKIADKSGKTSVIIPI